MENSRANSYKLQTIYLFLFIHSINHIEEKWYTLSLICAVYIYINKMLEGEGELGEEGKIIYYHAYREQGWDAI
jgi:hypothetical protein